MRELNLTEIENVSGGWDNFHDPLADPYWGTHGNEAYHEDFGHSGLYNSNASGPDWFSGVHTASDGSFWLSEESAQQHESDLEHEAQCESVRDSFIDGSAAFLGGDLSTNDYAAISAMSAAANNGLDCGL